MGDCEGFECHGSDEGWQTAYGDGQAVFEQRFVYEWRSVIFFRSGYWIFDGQVGGEDDPREGYGFKLKIAPLV